MLGETMNTEPDRPVTLIGAFRDATLTVKGIACVVILAFGGLVTTPAVAAVKQEVKQIPWNTPDDSSTKLSETLKAVHHLLDTLPVATAAPAQTQTQTRTKTATPSSATSTHAASAKATPFAAPLSPEAIQALNTARGQLRAYRDQLKTLDQGTLAQFASVKAHLLAHHLPQVILDRQANAVAMYQTRMAALMTELNAADSAPDLTGFQQHLATMKAQLDKELVKPIHEKFDPNHLPFSVAKPKHIKPRLTKKEYQATLFKRKPIQVASIGSMAGLLASTSLPSDPNDPRYLAPTDDVQITDAIKAKATELHHNPVEIYNWVHNSIEYIPTYGSIQGSDLTLQTLRGNDFDTASLLIALLRASNIPARYVYGTIQVPIQQVENWVGGVTDPNAALNLLGQGGIPSTGIVEGGQIKYVQMEHVWVEAWVDYFPSRAARPGPGNTWVPLDASFKQYTYTPGLDLQKAVPFDAAAFAEQIQSTAQINTAEGWIQNIDQNTIQSQLSNYQQQVSTYLNGVNPNLTTGQLVGYASVINRSVSMLSGSLPYRIMAVGNRMVALPDILQDKFQYELDDANGNVIFKYIARTSTLAGKQMALSFTPSSTEDAKTIASYVPAASTDGTPVPLSDFPKTLPAYLINLTPQLSVDGHVVSTGISFQIGTNLQSQKGYWTPKDGWVLRSKVVTAGQYQGIGIDLQGISQQQLDNMQQQILSIETELQNKATTDLTKDNVLGQFFYAGLLAYFAINDSQDSISAPAAHVVAYRAPSFGTFSSIVKTEYLYGIPVAISFPGVRMDIGHVDTQALAMDASQTRTVQFLTLVGLRASALENIVPQELVSNIDPGAQGLSAVEALAIAGSEGQKIYVINSTNIGVALPQLQQSPDVISDIQNAVAAGDMVEIPQSTITHAGWTGTGYVISDPTTGAGAYKISGGANGGDLIIGTFVALGLIALMAFSLLALPAALIVYGVILFQALNFWYKEYKITRCTGTQQQKLLALQQASFMAVLGATLSFGIGVLAAETDFIDSYIRMLQGFTLGTNIEIGLTHPC